MRETLPVRPALLPVWKSVPPVDPGRKSPGVRASSLHVQAKVTVNSTAIFEKNPQIHWRILESPFTF